MLTMQEALFEWVGREKRVRWVGAGVLGVRGRARLELHPRPAAGSGAQVPKDRGAASGKTFHAAHSLDVKRN